MTDASAGATWREGGLFVGLVALSRLTILGLLAWLVQGREFTDDVRMLMGMARSPFELLSGITGVHGQHPPFLAVLESVFAWPLSCVLSDFYAMRLTFIAYEVLTALFFWLALRAMVAHPGVRRQAEAAFLLLPMGWMTSSVMAQDEVVAACFMAAVLWLVAIRRFSIALLVCGFGVVAAKIFLAVPLLALIVVLPHRRVWTRAMLGGAPILIVYAWVTFAAWARGNGAPLAGFTPNAEFGVNIWVVLVEHLHLAPETSRRWSGMLALAGGSAPLVLWVLGERAAATGFSPRRIAALIVAMLLAVFTLFYHINPEYYVMVLPALLLAFRGRRAGGIVAVLATVPWAVNFFYGVRNAMADHTSGAKGVFVRLYQQMLPIDPDILFHLSLWTCIFMTVWVALAALRLSRVMTMEE